PRPRSAHVVRLHDAAGGRAVTIGQMHGLRDLAGKHDTPARRVQAERFAALLAGVVQGGDARVLCGDFNVEPGSETLRILEGLGMVELVTARGLPGTRTALYPKPGRFADYMLVDAGRADAPFEVVRAPEVSDHCPLLLTL
ncbi:MAG: endonuclease/exonuclease/phosphatase family protein, partial [Rhizobiales bacterium]|nr:endonuclease/exonuclease/phosphatase family protein [Hyphomicrobiales bacterium]